MESRLKWDLNGADIQVRKHKGRLCWTSLCLIGADRRSRIVHEINEATFTERQDDAESQWLAVMNRTCMALYKTHAQKTGLDIQNALRRLCGMDELGDDVLCSFSRRYNRTGWGWWEWKGGKAVDVRE